MGDPQTLSSRLIGAIFVQRGFVTQEQLEEALAIQSETGERLGEILVGRFGVPRLELASALAEQWADLERRSSAGSVATVEAPRHMPQDEVDPESRRPIGEIFVERGFVSENDLEQALETQGTTGERLGEVLVAQGAMTRLELASALAEQWSGLQKLRPPAPKPAEAWQEVAVRSLGETEPVPPTVTAAQADELRSAIAVMHERIEELAAAGRAAATADELRRSTEVVSARLDALEAGLESTASEDPRLAGLEARVDELGAALDEVRSAEAPDLDRLQADLRQIEERLDAASQDSGLAEKVDTALARTDATITAIESLASRVDQLTVSSPTVEAVEELRRAVDELSGRAGEHEAIDDLRGQVEALSASAVDPGTLESIRASLDELGARVGETASALPRQESLDELGHRIAELESRSSLEAELQARITALTDGIAQLARSSDVDQIRARLDEIAARPDGDPSVGARLDEVSGRLDELAARPQVDPSVTVRLGELRAEVEAVAARPVGDPMLAARIDSLASQVADLAARPVVDPSLSGRLDALDERVGEVASRPAPDPLLPERLDDLARRVETQLADDRQHELRTAIDELRARLDTVPAVRDSDLRSTIDAVREELTEKIDVLARGAARGEDVDALSTALAVLRVRVESITDGTALEALDSRLSEALDEQRTNVASLSARFEDGVRRLSDVDRATVELSGLVSTVRDDLARLAERHDDALAGQSARIDDLAGLGHRLDELHQRIDATTDGIRSSDVESLLAERDAALAALRDELGWLSGSLDQRLEESVARARAGIEERLDQAPSRGELDAMARDLGLRLGALEPLAHEAIRGGELEQLRNDLTGELEARLAELSGRLASVDDRATRGELESLAGELGSRVESIEPLAHGAARADDLEAMRTDVLDQVERRLADVHQRLSSIDETATRVELEALAGDMAARLGELEHATRDGVVSHELEAVRNDLASMLESGLDELRGRLVAVDEGATRTDLATLADDLAARVNDLVTRLEAAEGAADSAHARVGEIDGVLGGAVDELHAAVAHVESTLAQRLQVIEERLGARIDAVEAQAGDATSGIFETIDTVASGQAEIADRVDQIGGAVEAIRSAQADLAERQLVETAELGARLDDLARRVTAEVKEVGGQLAGLHEEIERTGASAGWRLERLEETLASEDRDAVRTELAVLAKRLDGEAARIDEQARVTERAVRKGLAGLGERLASTEQSYFEAGNALRRSIERLGAAVVEADARIADEPLDPPAAGFVAFTPTADGYRLVAVEGTAPGVGDLVTVPGWDEPLVATRVGVSPLPLDRRACVYLDRPSSAE